MAEFFRNIFEQASSLAALYGMNLLAAVVLLIVGWIAAAWTKTGVERALGRVRTIDDTLTPVLANTARYAVLVFVIIAVLARFGVQTASLIALLGAAGLAVGLALQGTLQNIAAGIMLLFIRPFRAGDYIDADGIAGSVIEIGLFVTELKTFDGVFLAVPNAHLWGRSIRNYSRNETRRVDVAIGISYDDDVDGAMEALLGLLKSDERVLGDPEPQVMVVALADSSVNINMRCWTHRDNYWGLLFTLNKQGKAVLEAAGHTIPFPQRDVHLIPVPETETKPNAA